MKRRDMDTEDLVDDLWDALLPAALGTVIAFAGVVILGIKIFGVPIPALGVVGAILAVGLGIWTVLPWTLASAELDRRRYEKRQQKYARRAKEKAK